MRPAPSVQTTHRLGERGILYGQEAVTEGGYRAVADKEKNVHPVGILRTRGARTIGMGSWLTTQAFDATADRITEGLGKAGKIDGVLLALHGAMAVDKAPLQSG